MSNPQWKLHLDTYHIVRRLEFPIIWELETPHKVLIASGDKVVAGMPGEVITIKEIGGEPAITFQSQDRRGPGERSGQRWQTGRRLQYRQTLLLR